MPMLRAGIQLGGAPTLVHEPSGFAAWITDPPGFVMQFDHDHFLTGEMARFITGPVFERMKLARGDRKDPFILVNDWSTMSGYDTAARNELTKWAFNHRKEIDRVVVMLPPGNALVRMGVEVAATSLRLAGMRVTLADSLAEQVMEHRLRRWSG